MRDHRHQLINRALGASSPQFADIRNMPRQRAIDANAFACNPFGLERQILLAERAARRSVASVQLDAQRASWRASPCQPRSPPAHARHPEPLASPSMPPLPRELGDIRTSFASSDVFTNTLSVPAFSHLQCQGFPPRQQAGAEM